MAEEFDMDFGTDIYTLVDEDGVEQTFEKRDEMDVDDVHYYALVPYYDNPEKELEVDQELVILKSEYDENDEEVLVTIDDDDEYERIGNIFLDRLNEMYE